MIATHLARRAEVQHITKRKVPDSSIGPPSRVLGQSRKRRENRASTMARQLARIFRQLAIIEAKEAVAEIRRSEILQTLLGDERVEVKKAPTKRELEHALRRVLIRQGERAVSAAARRTAGGPVAIPDAKMREFLRTKEVLLQQIMSSMRRDVRESVRAMVAASVEEIPRPSIGELARRIHSSFHGTTTATGETRGGSLRDYVPAPGVGVLPTELARTTDDGPLYVFSPQRAELIARTEMAQAENTGIYEGYRATGAVGLEWLAYDDGRSGDRRHDEMKGEAVAIGEDFVLPDGARMRYPGDPAGPIRHTANCRCTTRAIFDADELELKRQR